ncbi:MAG: 5-(carboxyamino)imidazole ribonucleotide mutase [Pirellulales bacterium]|jgi:5-(carboxyamino)imidazole ribonucleotide mutase
MAAAADPAASPTPPLVAVVMGSRSDWGTLERASTVLTEFGVAHECAVVSAHRTPERMAAFAREAAGRGLKVIIAGAGGAAHLPGMFAAQTHLPVFGVPVESAVLRGVDSLLSIVQMPAGVPVGTLAIGPAGAANAALLAVAVLALSDTRLADRLIAYRAAQTDRVLRDSLDGVDGAAVPKVSTR